MRPIGPSSMDAYPSWPVAMLLPLTTVAPEATALPLIVTLPRILSTPVGPCEGRPCEGRPCEGRGSSRDAAASDPSEKTAIIDNANATLMLALKLAFLNFIFLLLLIQGDPAGEHAKSLSQPETAPACCASTGTSMPISVVKDLQHNHQVMPLLNNLENS